MGGLLSQLSMLAKGDEREMNFMLSLVKGLEPAIRPEGRHSASSVFRAEARISSEIV
jgi:hypothetical protein